MMTSQTRTALTTLLLVSLMGLFGGCTESADTPVAESPVPAGSAADRVQFSTLSTGVERALVDLPADVILPENARHEIGPPFSGRLLELSVETGAEVMPGSPLAHFASADLAALRASLAEARKRLKQRRLLLAKRKKHVESGMQPIQTVYAAEEALADARAHVTALEQELEAWERHMGEAPTAGDGVQWVSPVRGVVSEIQCSPGTVVGPEQVCLTVLDTSHALVRVRLPERHLSADLDDVELEWQGFGPRREGSSRLSFVRADPAIDPLSRTLALYFTPGSSGPLLRVGATGRGTVVRGLSASGETDGATLVAPRSAVTRLRGERVVFARGDDGRAEPVPVEMVGRQGAEVLIRAPRLSTRTPIAIRGVFFLKSTWLLANEG